VLLLLLRSAVEDGAASGRDLPGASPSQAGERAALGEHVAVPIAATMALEIIGPMAGTVIRCSPAGLSPPGSGPMSRISCTTLAAWSANLCFAKPAARIRSAIA
jgi:hypothetical protein